LSTSGVMRLSEANGFGTIPPGMAGDIYSNKAIGERLEITRRSLGIGQEVMAERLEPFLPKGEVMSGQKWNNYARGRDRIPVEMAIAVCVVAGVNLDYIYRNEWGSLPPDVANRLHKAMTSPVRRFRRP